MHSLPSDKYDVFGDSRHLLYISNTTNSLPQLPCPLCYCTACIWTRSIDHTWSRHCAIGSRKYFFGLRLNHCGWTKSTLGHARHIRSVSLGRPLSRMCLMSRCAGEYLFEVQSNQGVTIKSGDCSGSRTEIVGSTVTIPASASGSFTVQVAKIAWPALNPPTYHSLLISLPRHVFGTPRCAFSPSLPYLPRCFNALRCLPHDNDNRRGDDDHRPASPGKPASRRAGGLRRPGARHRLPVRPVLLHRRLRRRPGPHHVVGPGSRGVCGAPRQRAAPLFIATRRCRV